MAWWLLQTVAAGAILAAAVRVACLTGRIGPVARHALWTLVLVKLLTPPLVVWPLALEVPAFEAGSRAAAAPAPDHIVHASLPTPSPQVGPAAIAANPATAASAPRPALAGVSFALLLVWAVGSAIFALIHAARIRRMVVCVRAASVATPRLRERVDAIAGALALPSISIHVVGGLDSPAIWSMGRPRLLWPESWADDGLFKDGAEDDLDDLLGAFIVHELAHVKRRDHWAGWLELVCGIVWWWNPLFWYVRTHVRENAELACDAWVADERPAARRIYAETLLSLYSGRSRMPRAALVAGAVSGNRRFLERRLAVIMRNRESVQLSRAAALCCALVAVLVLPAVAAQRATGLDAVAIPPAPSRPFAAGLPAVRASFAPADAAQSQALPPDAQTLADRFARDQAEAIRQAETRIAQQRSETIKQLQALQDQHTRAGHLDEALAVRERIRQLQSSTPSDAVSAVLVDPANGKVTAVNHYPILPDPQTLTRLRDRVGETFYFSVSGREDGTVWGDGPYTDDSALATAAVHAGILKPGETGVVRVTIHPGMSRYDASFRNSIQTLPYARWDGSFRIADPTSAPEPVRTDVARRQYVNASVNLDDVLRGPPSLVVSTLPGVNDIAGHGIGDVFYVTVTGNLEGSVWGSGVYTGDSEIEAAAVHAGVLRPGEQGRVRITVVPGQDQYEAAERNGVKSMSWGSWGISFRLARQLF